jgi:hypothetical protein
VPVVQQLRDFVDHCQVAQHQACNVARGRSWSKLVKTITCMPFLWSSVQNVLKRTSRFWRVRYYGETPDWAMTKQQVVSQQDESQTNETKCPWVHFTYS